MEIEQTHIVLRASNFDLTCQFYEQVLGFPRLATWGDGEVRGASFAAGNATLDVLGLPLSGPERRRRGTNPADPFDYQGPRHKLSLTFTVPSAEAAYEQLQFRDRNIPGGLRTEPDGCLVFATHDPDGVPILFREQR